jgi:glutamyl-tRNA reductase
MNLLVVGVSHRTANVGILERLAASPQDAPQLLTDLMSQAYVGEAMVLSTCNRVEVYAGVTAFHGGLTDIAGVLAARLGSTAADLAPFMYVHYDSDAAKHAFRVATGLDSMVVGEPQILGQLRDAYGLAIERDTAGRLIHDLMQQALRVGKRAHAETGIDKAGQSIVTAALDVAGADLPGGSLTGVSALVVGAGSMGALAMATLRRAGAGAVAVTNRDEGRAARLAELHGGTAVPFADLADAVAAADLVISATAATDHVIRPEHVRRPTVILDLAVPRDVDPAVASLPGVTLIDMESLGASLREDRDPGDLVSDAAAVETIVASEVDAFRQMLRGASVAPTVAAPSPTPSGPTWHRWCTGWSSGCCTCPRCGYVSWPPDRAATGTPKCCANYSTWTSRRPWKRSRTSPATPATQRITGATHDPPTRYPRKRAGDDPEWPRRRRRPQGHRL